MGVTGDIVQVTCDDFSEGGGTTTCQPDGTFSHVECAPKRSYCSEQFGESFNDAASIRVPESTGMGWGIDRDGSDVERSSCEISNPLFSNACGALVYFEDKGTNPFLNFYDSNRSLI